MSIKELIKNSPKKELDYFSFYKLTIKNNNINLYVSKKRATKSTHIHCTESGDVIWEQFYLFGGMSRPAREKKYVLKPECDKNTITVIVIRGNFGDVIGLDNGIFKSHLSPPLPNFIYLMRERIALKFLEII